MKDPITNVKYELICGLIEARIAFHKEEKHKREALAWAVVLKLLRRYQEKERPEAILVLLQALDSWFRDVVHQAVS